MSDDVAMGRGSANAAGPRANAAGAVGQGVEAAGAAGSVVGAAGTDGLLSTPGRLTPGLVQAACEAYAAQKVPARKRIAVLGCTGSIGLQTLDVAKQHPESLQVTALAANRSVDATVDAALEFGVKRIAFGDEGVRGAEALGRLPEDVQVAFGPQALLSLVHADDVDCVVNALVGAAGMRASFETLASGRQLALANKESLVVAGDLIMPLAREMDRYAAEHGGAATPGDGATDAAVGVGATGGAAAHGWTAFDGRRRATALMPIDSEHGAIYQCLVGERHDEVSALWVTASGGPFRGRTRDELAGMTAKQALAHPTWKMGPKITIDSSTLMNKGLEVIEAHHLFDMTYDRIKVVVQPQSAIHSMVEFADGSVKAHLGTTDMRIPIQFALSYPDRWEAPCERLDFTKLGTLEFYPVDDQTFRCFALARHAGEVGGTLPCVMNAANEVAVAAFLDGACGYLDIDGCVGAVMDAYERDGVAAVESLDQLAEVDAWAREQARLYLQQ